METGLWFKMMMALVLIGTMASLISGAPVPDVTLTLNIDQLLEPATDCVGFWCFLVDWGIAIINFVWMSFNVLLQGVTLLLDSFAYFSGIAAVLGTGSFALPFPLNGIFLVAVLFGWFFLGAEVGRRIMTALGRGG